MPFATNMLDRAAQISRRLSELQRGSGGGGGGSNKALLNSNGHGHNQGQDAMVKISEASENQSAPHHNNQAPLRVESPIGLKEDV